MSENNTSEFINDLRERMRLHQAIGNLIGESKAKLFRTSREGGNIEKAASQFMSDMLGGFGRLFAKPDLFGEPHIHTTKEHGTVSTGGYDILNEEEIEYICEQLGDDSGGSLFIALQIALLEHLLAVSLAKGDVEDEFIKISRQLFIEDRNAPDEGLEHLMTKTRRHLSSAIAELKQEEGVSHAAN